MRLAMVADLKLQFSIDILNKPIFAGEINGSLFLYLLSQQCPENSVSMDSGNPIWLLSGSR